MHVPNTAMDVCGSGIYGSNVTYAVRNDPVSTKNALMVESIPMSPCKIVPKFTSLSRDLLSEVEHQDNISTDLYNPVYLKNNSGFVPVCDEQLCCLLTYDRLNRWEDVYALEAVKELYKSNEYHLQICTFSKCSNTTTTTCSGNAWTSNSHFSFLNLTRNFSTLSVYPMVMTNDIDPWDGIGSILVSSKVSNGTCKPFVSATMYARRFDLDHSNSYINSNINLYSSSIHYTNNCRRGLTLKDRNTVTCCRQHR